MEGVDVMSAIGDPYDLNQAERNALAAQMVRRVDTNAVNATSISHAGLTMNSAAEIPYDSFTANTHDSAMIQSATRYILTIADDLDDAEKMLDWAATNDSANRAKYLVMKRPTKEELMGAIAKERMS